MRRGRPDRLEFEYERKGTRNIFAAFDIRDGRVLLWVTEDRTTPMVLSFLDHIVRHYRRGPIVIITDNISTRTGAAAAEWLRQHPRVRFVFTPTHGSWLNQVEIWFGILTRSALRHRSFANVRDLAAAIYKFGRHWNNVLWRHLANTYYYPDGLGTNQINEPWSIDAQGVWQPTEKDGRGAVSWKGNYASVHDTNLLRVDNCSPF